MVRTIVSMYSEMDWGAILFNRSLYMGATKIRKYKQGAVKVTKRK